ncbi:MAG: glycosyltransferase family 4 protein [Chloroflexi bacterium]|nr:glycosyltransferase family 4 protein [Chloroflexota bacterium]
MRLLLLTPAFPPFHGGGERYVAALGHALAAQGAAVTVLTSTAEREADFWDGTAITPTTEAQEGSLRLLRCALRPCPGGRAGLMVWRKLMVVAGLAGGSAAVPLLLRLMRRVPALTQLECVLDQLAGQIDIIHGFNISWEYPLVAGWQAAHQWGIPFVATPFAHLGAEHGDKVARNSTMPHQLAALRGAAAVLTLTNVEAEGLAGYGVSPSRLHPIGGGLDPLPTGLEEETAVRERFGLPARYAIFIGRASYDKGAVHAAQALLQVGQTLVLVGQLSPEFERFYGQLGSAERALIRPLGPQDEATKHSLLRASQFLLLPSRTDSFGIVLLEAWAHGLPVIGARAGGIPGVVTDGQTGVLVPFGEVAVLAEASERLLADESWRQELGRNGRSQLAHHHWPTIGRRVMSLYEAVLPPGGEGVVSSK